MKKSPSFFKRLPWIILGLIAGVLLYNMLHNKDNDDYDDDEDLEF